MSRIDIAFGDLPETISVFPLSGVLLLPRGRLPLNIFEPRYMNMFEDALASDRLIGMIQPTEPEEIPVDASGDIKDLDHENLPLHRTGCAGRIVSFEETEDDRLLITLKGTCRFKTEKELAQRRGYRRITADWSPYRQDLKLEEVADIDRERLLEALRTYFKEQGLSADWSALEGTPDEALVTSLAMTCPFGPVEKQALLEAPDLLERSRVLTALVEMAAYGRSSEGQARQ